MWLQLENTRGNTRNDKRGMESVEKWSWENDDTYWLHIMLEEVIKTTIRKISRNLRENSALWTKPFSW